MRCYRPIPAARTPYEVRLHPPEGWGEPFALPCGNCINCKMNQRLGWALRARHEALAHPHTAFITLTYNDDHLRPGLQLRDLQLYLKRLRRRLDRKSRKLRHFCCGEYGEQNGRPHYHGLIFGMNWEDKWDAAQLEAAWQGQGYVHVRPADTGAIHYVVGYQLKKATAPEHEHYWGDYEEMDYETGEITAGRKKNYLTNPPFRIMSKNPGLGHQLKKHRTSWRLYAELDGKKMPVPRFLHEHWKNTATLEEKASREADLWELQKARARTTEDAHAKTYLQLLEENEREIEAKEAIAEAKMRSTAHKKER